MQQAGFKRFNLSHPLNLRRVGFLAVKPFEFYQLVSHPGAGDPKHEVLQVLALVRLCGGFAKQRLDRHAVEGTPSCLRKI